MTEALHNYAYPSLGCITLCPGHSAAVDAQEYRTISVTFPTAKHLSPGNLICDVTETTFMLMGISCTFVAKVVAAMPSLHDMTK
jgi:hypothetical protein